MSHILYYHFGCRTTKNINFTLLSSDHLSTMVMGSRLKILSVAWQCSQDLSLPLVTLVHLLYLVSFTLECSESFCWRLMGHNASLHWLFMAQCSPGKITVTTITAYKVPRNWLWPSKTMLLTPLGFWISSIINESSCIPWYYFDPLCPVPDVVQFYTAVLLYLHSYLNPHSYTGDRTTTTYITWTSTDVFFYR